MLENCVGTEEDRLLIVHLKSKHVKKDLAVHDENVMGLLQDKDLIITAGTDGKIRTWDLLRLEKGMEPKLYDDVNIKVPVMEIKTSKHSGNSSRFWIILK